MLWFSEVTTVESSKPESCLPHVLCVYAAHWRFSDLVLLLLGLKD